MTTLRTSKLLLAALAALAATGCPTAPQPEPLEAAPVITQFTVSATEVVAGDSVTLTWAVEHSTEVRVEELTLGTISGVDGASGSVEVAITAPSIFILTAKNARGATDSAAVAVRLTGAPDALLFTAAPLDVQAGEPVTLAWSAPGSGSLTVTASPGGPVDLGGQGASGAVVVRPVATTTYTLEAGGRTATATVTVRASITSFAVTPGAALPGGTVTLRWTTLNAERVQLLAPGRAPLLDSSDAAVVAAGSFVDTLPDVADPAQVFSYELRVSARGETLTRTLSVTVPGSPAVTSFTAPPLARAVDGGVITLAWVTTGADAVSLAANGAEFYRSPNPALAAAGTLELPAPAADTTYRITATAERGGRATASAVVDSVGLPTATLTASPTSVAGGGAVTLSWTGQNLRAVTLSSPTLGVLYRDTGVLDTGSSTVRLNAGTTVTLTGDNGVGDTVTAVGPALTVTAPLTLAVAETGSLRFGQAVTVSAPTAGATVVGLPHGDVAVRPGSAGFVDISGTGTKLEFPTTGNIVATIDVPFRTVLFGRTVGERITVARYGHLVFSDHLNGNNSVDEALPSTKLPPMTVAPYWESLTVSGVYWELRPDKGSSTLVVQWTSSTANFQALISSTGQIDFEYGALPTTVNGRAGVMGPSLEQSLVAPGTPAVGRGVTFFGPKPSPVLVPAYASGRMSGAIEVAAGEYVRAEGTLTAELLRPDQLALTEVLADSTVGAAGQWVELKSWSSAPVALAGWSLTVADGGAVPLSGTIPPGGALVLGGSADPALNDDAGVQLAVSGLALAGDPFVALSRAGLHQRFELSLPDGGRPAPGVALVADPGPYRVGTTSAFPAGARWCLATQAFGSQAPQQLGTPGADTGCGFPYAKTTIAAGFFDIADGGTPLALAEEDDAVATVSLAAAPVPFFGVARTALVVHTNGFLSFDLTTTDTGNLFSSTTPSTTDSNAVVAAFADDLQISSATFGDSGLYARRTAQGEDPFAPAPHWIVQWQHVSHYTSTVTSRDDLTFQVKLFDDGVIELHFAELRSLTSTQYASGSSAITWLESPDGTQALTINANSTVPGISPHSAFRFVPR